MDLKKLELGREFKTLRDNLKRNTQDLMKLVNDKYVTIIEFDKVLTAIESKYNLDEYNLDKLADAPAPFCLKFGNIVKRHRPNSSIDIRFYPMERYLSPKTQKRYLRAIKGACDMNIYSEGFGSDFFFDIHPDFLNSDILTLEDLLDSDKINDMINDTIEHDRQEDHDFGEQYSSLDYYRFAVKASAHLPIQVEKYLKYFKCLEEVGPENALKVMRQQA